MSEKWTPEPWVYGFPMQYSTHQDIPATPHPESDPVWLLDGNDYIRAVACVNACIGMVDPAKEIALLRDQNAAMRNALVQARGALLLDHMVDDDGKPFGTTVVAIEAIDAALATKELTDGA